MQSACSNEEWRDIPNLGGYYQVSNKGRIRSVDRMVPGKRGFAQPKKGKFMKPIQMPNGYLSQGFYFEGKHRQYYIHRLVAKAFIPNPDDAEKLQKVVDYLKKHDKTTEDAEDNRT